MSYNARNFMHCQHTSRFYIYNIWNKTGGYNVLDVACTLLSEIDKRWHPLRKELCCQSEFSHATNFTYKSEEIINYHEGTSIELNYKCLQTKNFPL